MPIRVGAVSYLNTKPLIHGFDDFAKTNAELHLDLPSRLAEQLKNDELDVALIPIVEYFRNPDWIIVSDACIGCFGPVWSVKLLFRVEPEEVKTISLDEGSRTSAVLAQILLADRFGIRPQTHMLPIETDPRTSDGDCVLVIGDRAMQERPDGFIREWDLGLEWKIHTGLPFVFAMWVARPGLNCSSGNHQEISQKNCVSDTCPFFQTDQNCSAKCIDTCNGLRQLLENCRDAGLANIEKLAETNAANYNLTIEQCHRYFTEHLNFKSNPQSLEGLELYRQKALAYGFIPEAIGVSH